MTLSDGTKAGLHVMVSELEWLTVQADLNYAQWFFQHPRQPIVREGDPRPFLLLVCCTGWCGTVPQQRVDAHPVLQLPHRRAGGWVLCLRQ